MKRTRLVLLIVVTCLTWLRAADKRPVQPEDLYTLRRVSDPQISPDGRWVAYAVSDPCLESNAFDSDIWLVPVQGGTPRKLTNSPDADHSPRWSPDGKWIAFLSDRGGRADLWIISPQGGEAVQVTHSETDLADPVWVSDGERLLCRSRVMPEGKTNEENPYIDELPLCEARAIDHLLFRQWDRWLGNERNHVLLISLTDGSLRDLTPGDFDTPPVSLASGHDVHIAPDGEEICFVKVNDPHPAATTNQDIFTLSLSDEKVRRITDNPALDHHPVYGPGGRYIAYAAMEKPGYEADTKRLMLYDRRTGGHRCLTPNLDRSVGDLVWHPQGRRLFFTARDEGAVSIFSVETKGGEVERLTNEGSNADIRITPDGKTLVFVRSACHRPAELYAMPAGGGEARAVTHANAEWLEEIALPVLEPFWFTGADGNRVQGFLLRPPDFDADKKYPAVLTIHGGPQNMWGDRFMTTWFTFPLVTAPGYVGIFINPRGSTGYGAKFREQVSRDYGGRCYEDLMAGMDYCLGNYDFIDGDRLAAIGGSFGGYSVNWIMGHTDRFKCIVSHAGLYNLTSFYGATEEIWFPAWDMGASPWEEPDLYDQWSPHRHAAAFKTPTLVIHGQQDFRVNLAESLQLFTALQMQDVPSRFVYFPDEGHVVSIPQNNVRWWKEMYRWLDTYLK